MITILLQTNYKLCEEILEYVFISPQNEIMLADQSCERRAPIVPSDIVLGRKENWL